MIVVHMNAQFWLAPIHGCFVASQVREDYECLHCTDCVWIVPGTVQP